MPTSGISVDYGVLLDATTADIDPFSDVCARSLSTSLLSNAVHKILTASHVLSPDLG